MKTLTPEEIESLLTDNPGWTYTAGMLVREWHLDSFGAAMTLVNKVAGAAESMNHHPDINIRYSKVRLGLWTHDADGVTTRDKAFITRLAAELDRAG